MTAACTLRARDRGGPELALQVLICPVVDHDMTNASYREHGSGEDLFLTAKDMEWFWNCYAPDPASRLVPDASPLRAEDLSNLPPAIVITAEYDPLRDEGIAYAERLRAAGVPVTASASTMSAESRLSIVSPYWRVKWPMPPPRVRPPTPVVEMIPEGTASPNAWVAWSTSPQVLPAPTQTVLAAGST